MKFLQDYLLHKGYVKVKLHATKTNHFELIAKINGKKGLFILDTGASNSCVGFESVSQFQLSIQDSDIKAAGAGAINMNTQISKNNWIQLGKWKMADVDLVLFDLSHINTALTNQKAKSVHGIIGADLLKIGKAIIDYEKKYLYLK